MSDIPDGFSFAPPPPPNLDEVIKHIDDLIPYINRLSTSQSHTVGVLNKINSNILDLVKLHKNDFQAFMKNQEEYQRREEKYEKERKEREEDTQEDIGDIKDQLREGLAKDSEHQKKVLKAFEELIESNLDNTKWIKENYTRIVREEIKPLAREVNRSYTNTTREFVDKNFLSSVGNEFVKNIPGLGLLLGKSTSGPGSHDDIMKIGRKNIYESHAKEFRDRSEDILARNMFNKAEYGRYKKAKSTLNKNTRQTRATYTGSRGQPRGPKGGFSKEYGPRKGPQQYSPVDSIMREYTQGRASSDTVDYAMRQTTSYDLGAMMRLPEAYGGPAIFLANTIKETLGGNKKADITKSGLLDSILTEGAEGLVSKMGPFLLKLIPFLVGGVVTAGVVALILAMVQSSQNKNKDQIRALSLSGGATEDLPTAVLQNQGKATQEEITKAINSNMALRDDTTKAIQKKLVDERKLPSDFTSGKYYWKYDPNFNSVMIATKPDGSDARPVNMNKEEKTKLDSSRRERFIVENKNSPYGGSAPEFQSTLNKSSGFFQFHSGGIVPGASNAEVPSVLLGGERVLSHDQNKNIEISLNQLVELNKQLIEEMKRNTKVTDEKTVSISPVSAPTAIDARIGGW